MFPIHTILYPTDFSDGSRQVFQVARALARCFEARLVVVHVAPSNGRTLDFSHGLPTGTWEYAWSLRDMRETFQAPELRYPVDHRLRDGEIIPEILREAEVSHCDLIVMGTHGHEGEVRRLVGSIAEGVLRGAPCPVLTIKTPGARITDSELNRLLVESVS